MYCRHFPLLCDFLKQRFSPYSSCKIFLFWCERWPTFSSRKKTSIYNFKILDISATHTYTYTCIQSRNTGIDVSHLCFDWCGRFSYFIVARYFFLHWLSSSINWSCCIWLMHARRNSLKMCVLCVDFFSSHCICYSVFEFLLLVFISFYFSSHYKIDLTWELLNLEFSSHLFFITFFLSIILYH